LNKQKSKHPQEVADKTKTVIWTSRSQIVHKLWTLWLLLVQITVTSIKNEILQAKDKEVKELTKWV